MCSAFIGWFIYLNERFLSRRLNGLIDHFKMGLDCFFAVWFVVGNVWIFGGHTSPSDAPKLYRYSLLTAGLV